MAGSSTDAGMEGQKPAPEMTETDMGMERGEPMIRDKHRSDPELAMGTGKGNRMPIQGSAKRDSPRSRSGSEPEMEGGGPGGREDTDVWDGTQRKSPKTDTKMAVK